MKIAIASDHGGFSLKGQIEEHLLARGLTVIDLGTDSEESVDYPIYGQKCGKAVTEGRADLGIVICGTGIGISIAANKIRGIRCALCTLRLKWPALPKNITTPMCWPSAAGQQSRSWQWI